MLALPAWIAVFTVYNLYERQGRSISLATFDELGDLFHALLAGSLIFLILSQVLRRVMGAEVFFPVEAAIFLGHRAAARAADCAAPCAAGSSRPSCSRAAR